MSVRRTDNGHHTSMYNYDSPVVRRGISFVLDLNVVSTNGNLETANFSLKLDGYESKYIQVLFYFFNY